MVLRIWFIICSCGIVWLRVNYLDLETYRSLSAVSDPPVCGGWKVLLLAHQCLIRLCLEIVCHEKHLSNVQLLCRFHCTNSKLTFVLEQFQATNLKAYL